MVIMIIIAYFWNFQPLGVIPDIVTQPIKPKPPVRINTKNIHHIRTYLVLNKLSHYAVHYFINVDFDVNILFSVA